MVKKNKLSVVFDEDERNCFLKKFIGSKGASKKRAKKEAEKTKVALKRSKRNANIEIDNNDDQPQIIYEKKEFKESKYEDLDTVNNSTVEVITKVSKN